MENISPDNEFIQQFSIMPLFYDSDFLYKGAICAILLLFNGFEMGHMFNFKCRANNVVNSIFIFL